MGEATTIMICMVAYCLATRFIYNYLKQRFPFIWFLIYVGGTIVVGLWFAKIGIIGSIPFQTMQLLMLLILGPFMGHFFVLILLFWLNVFNLTGHFGGSVSELLNIGRFDGYVRERETIKIRRNDISLTKGVKKFVENLIFRKRK